MHDLQQRLSDLMDRNVVTVPPTATLSEATILMEARRTNGIYVIDERGRPLGILSSQVLLRHILPEHLRHPGDASLAAFESPRVLEKRVREVAGDRVDRFMKTPVHTLREDSSLVHAAVYLTEYRQLPVVDLGGRLVGSVSRTHLKQAIVRILESSTAP